MLVGHRFKNDSDYSGQASCRTSNSLFYFVYLSLQRIVATNRVCGGENVSSYVQYSLVKRREKKVEGGVSGLDIVLHSLCLGTVA